MKELTKEESNIRRNKEIKHLDHFDVWYQCNLALSIILPSDNYLNPCHVYVEYYREMSIWSKRK